MQKSFDRTTVLPTHTPQLFKEAVERASEVLGDGHAVVLPTETVYGLAANALEESAVREIFQIKGRPSHNPLIVHVHSLEMARGLVRDWPREASALANNYWPGPLTLVLPKRRLIAPSVTAGGDTVAIRLPSHPFMRETIARCGFPLAAPSANVSNAVSATTAQHCLDGLGGRVRLIVDGGACQVGIESTVVDLVSRPYRILRPGIIDRISIDTCLSRFLDAADGGLQQVTHAREVNSVLRSPGQLQKHYSPQARVTTYHWKSEAEVLALVSKLPTESRPCRVLAHTVIPIAMDPTWVGVIPCDPEAYARALYAEWHDCDRAGVKTILMEALPEGSEWDGIRDRIQRASAKC